MQVVISSTSVVSLILFVLEKLILGFLRRFRDPIRAPRISNRVPRIREIGSLQIQTGFLTFSLKKNPELIHTRSFSQNASYNYRPIQGEYWV